MAHMLDSMFSVREMPWHGLGTILDTYPETWREARELAGLNWEPEVVPVYTKAVADDGTETYHEVQASRMVQRSDTGANLAVVTESLSKSLFPNADLGPLIEAFLDAADGELMYETAGSLRGGCQVWVLVRAKEPFEVLGDPHGATLPFLAVQNSHDGSGSLRVQRLQTRIVCANTSAAADRESGKHGLEYVFRHTASIHDRVALAKQAVNGLSEDRVRYQEWAAELLAMPVTVDTRERFLAHFFPMPVAEKMISETVVRNIEKAREVVRGILAGPTSEGIADTAYGLVQASTEYLDHYRVAQSPETKFRRCMLSVEPARKVAERLVREACSAAS
jgi:phage/plasmid-like protein (TIGR03299 family)